MTARIHYLAPRGADTTIAYQRYYLLGLEEVARLRWSGPPALAHLVRGANAKVRVAYNLDRVVGRRRSEGHVGRYVADFGDRALRFSIDAHDARQVRDEEARGWSDVYFKANLWPGDDHPANVVPVVNGNGLLDRNRIELLRGLRNEPRDVDVAFITYFRPAREHLTRVFETLSSLRLRADLTAVLDESARPYADRLGRAGATVTSRPIPPEQLWARLARAKVVVLRPGRHGCLPWRTLDLLAMGSCIALVSPPGPAWPVPLREGIEYAGCGLEHPADEAVAGDSEYERLAEAVQRLVAGTAEADALRTAAGRYFDEYGAPERVGSDLLERLRAL